MVHRDCKPENVLLRIRAECKLLDLGSMRPVGRRSSVQGTLPYMAPEARALFGGEHLPVPALDVWGLACTFCMALTGDIVRDREHALKQRLNSSEAVVVLNHMAGALVAERERPPLAPLLAWLEQQQAAPLHQNTAIVHGPLRHKQVLMMRRAQAPRLVVRVPQDHAGANPLRPAAAAMLQP